MAAAPASRPPSAGQLIIRRPPRETAQPVLVSIPHFGTDPLPGVGPSHYRDPSYASFPYGYTDPFAAHIYGELHRQGATVVATPLSRLFVDVNRARDDFETRDGNVQSNRGVIRTHIRGDEALFRDPLSGEQAERRLRRYYDPFHEVVSQHIDRWRDRFSRVVLVDAHTASAKFLEGHEVVLGTGRGRTCSPALVEGATRVVREAGLECSLNVPGYSGGHLVRKHGSRGGVVQALQIEFNSGLIMRGTRKEYARACRDGLVPAHDREALSRCIACMRNLLDWLGGWCRGG